MITTRLKDHFNHTIASANSSKAASLLERYSIPKIQNCYLASGGLPASSNYYIIRRNGGGFFSILSSVLCHIQIAENLGFSPVIDFENFRTTYSENMRINNSFNMWEYYFEPIHKIPL